MILNFNKFNILFIINKMRVTIYGLFFFIDTYSVYIIIIFYNLATENEIILFCFLSYFIYLIQILDFKLFKLFKYYYIDIINKVI